MESPRHTVNMHGAVLVQNRAVHSLKDLTRMELTDNRRTAESGSLWMSGHPKAQRKKLDQRVLPGIHLDISPDRAAYFNSGTKRNQS